MFVFLLSGYTTIPSNSLNGPKSFLKGDFDLGSCPNLFETKRLGSFVINMTVSVSRNKARVSSMLTRMAYGALEDKSPKMSSDSHITGTDTQIIKETTLQTRLIYNFWYVDKRRVSLLRGTE